MHQVDKFKQRQDRNNGLQSKEVLAIQKTLQLLRLIFLYLPDRMKNGWNLRNIGNDWFPMCERVYQHCCVVLSLTFEFIMFIYG
jgi:hypothetical protein